MPTAQPLSAEELAQLLPRLKATVELAERYLEFRKPIELIRAKAGSRGPTPRKARAVAKPGPRRSKNGRRKSRAQSAQLRGKLLEYLKTSKDGARIGEMANALKTSPSSVSYALDKLRTEKKVKMVGKRSLARWHRAA
jgi:DNA-binding transcriptional ArsR family regulator